MIKKLCSRFKIFRNPVTIQDSQKSVHVSRFPEIHSRFKILMNRFTFQAAVNQKEGHAQRSQSEMNDIHGQMCDLRALSAQAGIR